jgi:hypothetical protein
MDEIKRLTPKQVNCLYMRPRDDKGTPRAIPYEFDGEDHVHRMARSLMETSGLTEAEARRYIHGER